MPTGVVLAGGQSTRFDGGDKAIAELAGRPMIRHVTDRLDPVIDELVVNCRDEQVARIDAAFADAAREPSFAVDPVPDRGPMAGIMTGLRAASAEYAVVVACDMPFVDPAFASHLLDRAAGHDAAVARIGDGWFQTTQAVYRAEPMANACERAIERGEGKIIEPLFELDYVVVEADEVETHAALDTFENVNTRAELDAAADRLRERRSD